MTYYYVTETDDAIVLNSTDDVLAIPDNVEILAEHEIPDLFPMFGTTVPKLEKHVSLHPKYAGEYYPVIQGAGHSVDSICATKMRSRDCVIRKMKEYMKEKYSNLGTFVHQEHNVLYFTIDDDPAEGIVIPSLVEVEAVTNRHYVNKYLNPNIKLIDNIYTSELGDFIHAQLESITHSLVKSYSTANAEIIKRVLTECWLGPSSEQRTLLVDNNVLAINKYYSQIAVSTVNIAIAIKAQTQKLKKEIESYTLASIGLEKSVNRTICPTFKHDAEYVNFRPRKHTKKCYLEFLRFLTSNKFYNLKSAITSELNNASEVHGKLTVDSYIEYALSKMDRHKSEVYAHVFADPKLRKKIEVAIAKHSASFNKTEIRKLLFKQIRLALGLVKPVTKRAKVKTCNSQ